MTIRSWQFSLIFAWYDLWVGAYYDRKGRALYLLPVPMLGLRIRFGCSDELWRALIEATPVTHCGDLVAVED